MDRNGVDMTSDYVATIPKRAGERLDAATVARIGSARLMALLIESAQRDPILRQRLYEILNLNEESARLLFVSQLRRPEIVTPNNLAQQVNPGEAIAPNPEGCDVSSGYMVGASPAMRRLFESIRRYAGSSAPVLLTGESGTGKELAARAIHERSAWNKGPFVAINCGALPTTLIASELFGYEKGAFTGAAGRKFGRIETAEGGTVFLDEIGDLPLETQVMLLRFLQEKTIERVGGNKPILVNTRVIAATHVNLRDAVAKGRFREDLFYRLNVLTAEMPRLKDRGDDILLLAHFFLHQFSKEIGRQAPELLPDAAAAINAHPWPGTVRELIACMRRAVVMSDGLTIRADDLGLSYAPELVATPDQALGKVRAEAEANLVKNTLERNRYNVKKSASELGVSRVTLYRLIQKHDIKIDRSSRNNW
jgi:DNA-binding NtrC family response regulator